jgi:transcriptional regulator with XRE-family HTH domain
MYNGYESRQDYRKEKKRIEREIKMDVNVNENFAKRLRELREARGVGVRELANILGISHASISMYENCKREPTVSVCKLFADYFGVTCDYLLGLTDEPKRR